MTSHSLESGNLDAFIRALEDVVSKASSVEEIGRWLDQQPFIESVQVMNYLTKTAPPQREILIDVRMERANVAAKAVTIYERGPGKYQLHRLRDASK